MAVDHYENFPVASVLCPPRLRQPIMAIYHFARTADDIADEGEDPPAVRLSRLATFRSDLVNTVNHGTPSAAWPTIFGPLGAAIREFKLPVGLLHDLLSAFEQDVNHTATGCLYADRQDLLAYCRLSANPVGRLLLHLYDIHDADALAQSDCICSALQLINFWQDLSVDIPRQRHYLTVEACRAHGVDRTALLAAASVSRSRRLIADEVAFAASLMHQGQALVARIPGRAGWELRLVIQGGLRILDKIRAWDHDTLTQRPTLTAWDLPVMLWRAARM